MFKFRVYDIYERFAKTVIGPQLRYIGKVLAQTGL